MSRESKNVLTGNCRLLTKWLLSVMVDVEGDEQESYLIKVADVHHTFITVFKNNKAIVSIVKKDGGAYDFPMDDKNAAREFHLRLFSQLGV